MRQDWIDELEKVFDMTPMVIKLKLFVVACCFAHWKLVGRLVDMIKEDDGKSDTCKSLGEVGNIIIGKVASKGMLLTVNGVDPVMNVTPMLMTVKNGSLDIVDLLLGLGVNAAIHHSFLIVAAAENGRRAAHKGHSDVVKFLLTVDGVGATVDGNIAIEMAALSGHAEVVRLLLGVDGVDPTVHNNYAIMSAAAAGHTEVVRLLLADGRVDPSVHDNFAIIMASACGYADVVKLFLDADGVDAAANGNEAIQKTAEHRNLEVVKLLLEDKNVDASANNNFALRKAMENGHYEIVKLLKEAKGVDVDVCKGKVERYATDYEGFISTDDFRRRRLMSGRRWLSEQDLEFELAVVGVGNTGDEGFDDS
ncbi:hypothetical protein HDU76_008302 [Blyttiomyces sp. JEL0837]|nr:hypothetical protein HDU76_008302 [Blyttiomyces sp. JEL0837]